MSEYMDRAKKLRAVVTPHHNCAQSVFVPFAEKYGLSYDDAMKIAANFGSGMKMGSVCGAVTGGLMALGLFGADDMETVNKYYRKIRENHDGILDCAHLLAKNAELGKDKKQHCDGMAFECVGLVENILKEQGKI